MTTSLHLKLSQCLHRRQDRRNFSRCPAVNLVPGEALLLSLAPGAAVLRIDRTGYLASGRPIDFTRGLYRSEIYDFIAELR